ncbi:MAG: phosphoribosyl-ATP diphosphatase [Planctomycetaceae bacterium]|nr:phosphoribosyl-ATP diphosphatase [Planctomycetaceae bacterium]
MSTLTEPPPKTPTEDAFDRLMRTIIERRDGPADRSYTQKLLAGGVAAIGAKICEEAAEVVDAATRLESRRGQEGTLEAGRSDGLVGRENGQDHPDSATGSKEPGTAGHLVHEAADLLYHLWVILAKHGITLNQVRRELDRRAGVSGLDEKAKRQINPSG